MCDVARRQQPMNHRLILKFALAVATGLLHYGIGSAQFPGPEPLPVWLRPVFDTDMASALFCGADPTEYTPASSATRIRHTQMLPGFVSDPPYLKGFDDLPSDSALAADSGPTWMTMNFGDDNPYLDPRRSGDPGGVGYVHFYSQLQLPQFGQHQRVARDAWLDAGRPGKWRHSARPHRFRAGHRRISGPRRRQCPARICGPKSSQCLPPRAGALRGGVGLPHGPVGRPM